MGLTYVGSNCSLFLLPNKPSELRVPQQNGFSTWLNTDGPKASDALTFSLDQSSVSV